jgi:hypothetical protein
MLQHDRPHNVSDQSKRQAEIVTDVVQVAVRLLSSLPVGDQAYAKQRQALFRSTLQVLLAAVARQSTGSEARRNMVKNMRAALSAGLLAQVLEEVPANTSHNAVRAAVSCVIVLGTELENSQVSFAHF